MKQLLIILGLLFGGLSLTGLLVEALSEAGEFLLLGLRLFLEVVQFRRLLRRGFLGGVELGQRFGMSFRADASDGSDRPEHHDDRDSQRTNSVNKRSHHGVLLGLMVDECDVRCLSKLGAHGIIPMAQTNIPILRDWSKGENGGEGLAPGKDA